MVRLRWTFALIIICVALFSTVITAFRIRDFQKTTYESVSELKKKQKCEDCDVHKLELHENTHNFRDGNIKRIDEGANKFAQKNKQPINDNIFQNVNPLTDEAEEVSEEDDDEGNENLIYLKQLASKWEEKQKASGIVSESDTKPHSSSNKITSSSSSGKLDNEIRKKGVNDNSRDDNDDEDDDDDDDKESSSKLMKSTLDINKKTISVLSNIMFKDKLNEFDKNKHILDSEDEDDDDNENNNKSDEDISLLKEPIDTEEELKKSNHKKKPKVVTKAAYFKPKETVKKIEIKDTLKTSDFKENESSVKSNTGNKESKSEQRENKYKIENQSSVGFRDKTKVELQIDSKENEPQNTVSKKDIRDIKVSEPKQVIKQKNIDKETKLQNEEKRRKHTEDISKSKSALITMSDDSQYSNKNESVKENSLNHVTDALHRRNLLISEFEDFYAFFPTFAPNFTRVHNPECRRHGQILLRQLRGTKLWALSLLDATGKIPSGILQGNGNQLGNFDQCLQSRARVQLDTGSIVKVQGKYCLARMDLKAEDPKLEMAVHLAQAKNLIKSRIDDPGHFVPRFSTLNWGVCVPSPCNPEDVEYILRDAIKHYQYKSGVSIRVKVDEQDCHMQKRQAWWEEWIGIPTLLTLSLYSVVVLLVIVATIQDFLARRKTEHSNAKATNENVDYDNKDTKNAKTNDAKPADSIISAFSLYRTISKLVSPATSDEISCIHGVRAIATIALLVAHKFLPVAVMPYTNRLKLSEVVSSPIWSWCRAGWMYTDCFLLLSGTLTAHRISSDNDSGAFKRILSRYTRLTPALLAVLLFYAYIWDNISVGPMWGALVTKNAQVCQEGWWWNILYVQNYFGFEDMCAPQTHQLALDMQLSILGGAVVWAMQSDLPALKALLPTLHVWTAFSRYKTAREHRLTLLAYHGVSVSQLYRTARLSYTSVIHRSTPYLIGLSLGLVLNTNIRHSKVLLALGWLISGTLWSLVWWAGYDSGSTQYKYSVTFAAQYAALAPISSALAIAWLIYAVHCGHCGFLRRILCCRSLAFISRISYALYLCQFIVYLTNAATVRTSSEFSLLSLIDVQEISLIFLSSLLLTLTFVIPIQSLPKFILLLLTAKDRNEKSEDDVLKNTQPSPKNPVKNQNVNEPSVIRNRQILIAHREVLEEIPEVETEYEHRRESHEGLDEILEEEEDEEALDETHERLDEEDLEIIEEEQGDDEDFWIDRDESTHRVSYSRNSDRDLDEWELTGNGNGRNGAQHYRYTREFN